MGLYTLGPYYPATAESISEAPWSDNDWGNELSFSASNGAGPFVTAATYDLEDQTFVLKGYNFPGLTNVPTAATIVGMQAILTANYFAGATAPKLDLAQLLNNQRTKGGTNMVSASLPDLASATTSTITIGSFNDLWGNSLSAAWVRHSGFGVAFGVSAKANNTKVSADTCTLQVWYTVPDAYTITNNGAVISLVPQIDSTYAPASAPVNYPYSGAVVANVRFTPDISIYKLIDIGYNQLNASPDGVYAYAPAGGATAYPYVGVVQVEAVADSALKKSKVLTGTVNAEALADSARIKAKVLEGVVVSNALTDFARAVVRKRDGSVNAEALADSALKKSKVLTGTVNAEALTEYARAIVRKRSGTAQAEALADSDRIKAKTLAGVVVAEALASYYRSIGIVRDASVEAFVSVESGLGKTKTYDASVVASVVSSDTSVYAPFTPVATDYPYVGAVVSEAGTGYASIKAKAYDASVGCEVVTDTVLQKTKNYAGATTAEAASVYDSFKAKIYVGDTSSLVVIEGVYVSTASVTREYSGDTASIVESGGAYSPSLVITKAYSGATASIVESGGAYSSSLAITKTYIGTATVMAESSGAIGRGWAYAQGSSLIVEIAGSVSKYVLLGPRYPGQVLITVTPDTARGFGRNRTGTVNIVADVEGQYRYYERVQEVLPVTSWSVEGKPSDGYSKESIPTRPGSIDGAYTEPLQDGAWDEYPVDGAYTSIGYFKEFKPFHRYTMTKEAVPSIGEYIAYYADGTYTADGAAVADGSVIAGGNIAGRSTEGKPS